MIRLRSAEPRRAAVAHIDVAHAGDEFRIALKRVAGARRFTLRVRAATRDVVLTMPQRGKLADAREFAERHAAWVGARLARLPKPVPFEPGARVPLRGADHLIVHRPDARGAAWVEDQPFALFGSGKAIVVAGEAPHLRRRLTDFLKREARADLEASVRRHCETLGLAPRKVTIRDTTSRWGSCSASGALNFSWRLILAPSFVLDYLAAHEVAHLKHMNHSARFWALTRKLAAQTDRAEAWLQAHGSSLHRFGAQGE
jgi:predicted metal-dependent hydrolase